MNEQEEYDFIDVIKKGDLHTLTSILTQEKYSDIVLGKALTIASSYDQRIIVQYLIDKEVDVNFMNSIAVKKAAEHGQLEILKMLQKNGADIHAEDESPLYQAVTNKHLNVVKYLVGSGADVNAKEGEILNKSISHLETFKFLEESGAIIDVSPTSHLVIWASYLCEKDVIAHLINKYNLDVQIILNEGVVVSNEFKKWVKEYKIKSFKETLDNELINKPIEKRKKI